LAAGYSIVSSKVPQGATVKALGVTPGDGDQVLRFDNAANNFVGFLYDDLGGSWVGTGVDPVNGPAIAVGEAFFYNNVAGTATFTRNFTVN
jgi:hypothetical protein